MHTQTNTLTLILQITAKVAGFSSIYNMHTKYKYAAAADRNWDLERVAENQEGTNPGGGWDRGVDNSFHTGFHFYFFHLITVHFEY